MHIKAKFKNGQFVPLEKVKLNEGEVVELDLIPEKKFLWKGALKGINSTSVELQHNIKGQW
jgi:predicted DNA-binding antitoxin AbrB/MazE fold protein